MSYWAIFWGVYVGLMGLMGQFPAIVVRSSFVKFCEIPVLSLILWTSVPVCSFSFTQCVRAEPWYVRANLQRPSLYQIWSRKTRVYICIFVLMYHKSSNHLWWWGCSLPAIEACSGVAKGESSGCHSIRRGNLSCVAVIGWRGTSCDLLLHIATFFLWGYGLI